MTRAFGLLFLILAVAADSRAADLTQDDYDIWHAALREGDARHNIYIWHVVEPLEALQRITLEGVLKDFPAARPTANIWSLEPAEIDVGLLQAAAERRPHRLPESPYVLLTPQALEEVVGNTPQPNWILNPALLPDAEAVCRLTRPVIRADGRVAYLVYLKSTEWWGALMSCSLHRDAADGTWRVDQCGRTDFTDWKDGKRTYEDEKVVESCSCH
jgi:hypothetical protein